MIPMIDAHCLYKEYGGFLAVNNISFTVEPGSLFAFLGTNGAGKSTTIHMLCTLLKPTAGQIAVSGYPTATHAKEVRKRIGIVFQENVLDDLLTVEDNLRIHGKLHGLSRSQLNNSICLIREQLLLEEIWNRPYQKLSGGQKRKCEIARALIGTPDLLILDEPTTGLDPQTRTDIWKLIRSLQQDTGLTVFLTTHYMEEAANADQAVILHKGEIRASGTPDALKRNYGKDTLKLRFTEEAIGQQKLARLGYTAVQSASYTQVLVADSNEALSVIHAMGEITDFELAKCSMDTVFLAVTKEKEVTSL